MRLRGLERVSVVIESPGFDLLFLLPCPEQLNTDVPEMKAALDANSPRGLLLLGVVQLQTPLGLEP